MRIMIDEDLQAHSLVRMLRSARHDVETVNGAGLVGQGDMAVLERAHQDRRVLVTGNAGDFHDLHAKGVRHSGILAVYRERDPGRNMAYRDIVNAIARIEAADLETTGLFTALNAWK